MKMASLQHKGIINYLIITTFIASASLIKSDEADFNELLEKTPYAHLLKELICMTDAIALLNHHMDRDERRLIEDSILGKIVRITKLIPQLDNCTAAIDVSYIHYWFKLAKTAALPPLILEELIVLEKQFSDYCEHKQ